MRIITGMARGTKLKTLEGNDTRPTTEMCKEGIFSAIQFELHDRIVLDLFGGCGQLALEALSRGAERAVIVDSSRAACEIIKEKGLSPETLYIGGGTPAVLSADEISNPYKAVSIVNFRTSA